MVVNRKTCRKSGQYWTPNTCLSWRMADGNQNPKLPKVDPSC